MKLEARDPAAAHRATLALAGALAILLVASAPAAPDDWDGIGFVRAATKFDLERFAPHPPGYPVYVALVRVAALVLAPLSATLAVSICAGVATLLIASAAAARAWGSAARFPVALAVASPTLAFRSMASASTESLALALACAAVWSLARLRRGEPHGWWTLGVAVGLGLGVRLSWAPLFFGALWLARGHRVRTAAVALVAVVAWAAPLGAVVGPAHLVELTKKHAVGHFISWGGGAWTRPGAVRLWWLARDLVVDGVGADRDLLGAPLGVALAVAVACGLLAWRSSRWGGWRDVVVLLGPYAAWILVGQNLAEQPRHALPLVVALAVSLARASLVDAPRRAVGAVLAALVMVRTGADAVSRKVHPPPAVSLLAYVRAQPDAARLAVFGGPSMRTFEGTELESRAATVSSLGEARLVLVRRSGMPSRTLVTDEIASPTRDGVTPLASWCRPERLDRRAPCLTVYEWKPLTTP